MQLAQYKDTDGKWYLVDKDVTPKKLIVPTMCFCVSELYSNQKSLKEGWNLVPTVREATNKDNCEYCYKIISVKENKEGFTLSDIQKITSNCSKEIIVHQTEK